MSRQCLRLLAGIFSVITLFSCASLPTPEYKDIKYDYVVGSVYPLTEAHKNIYFEIDAPDVTPPEDTLLIPTLKLKKVLKKRQAQVVVFIHVANSFLILRPAGMRKEVVFNTQQKGALKDVAIQRAHIRTHYNIEVVDVLADTLIDQFSGAKNYPIEALDFFNKEKNRQALKEVFLAESVVARFEVINSIWQGLESIYLKDVQVSFVQEKHLLVKSLETEPKLALAFESLNENNKRSAKKALNIYNALLKKYKKLEGDYNKKVSRYIDQGITVSTSIVNHKYQDRYPYYDDEF